MLNSCIFTIGKTTYVDFLPFFNPNSGSELSILRIIIHHKKFELLTHPLCELFLHLKLLRSRSLYWIVIILNFVFTFLTIIYVIWMYGNIGKANYTSDVWYFMIDNLFIIWSHQFTFSQSWILLIGPIVGLTANTRVLEYELRNQWNHVVNISICNYMLKSSFWDIETVASMFTLEFSSI